MKVIPVPLSILCLIVTYNNFAQEQRWKKGILTDEFIFEQAPFASCHASTIAETSNGLIAAWFGGTKERNPDVGIWISRRISGKWTEPAEVANGIINDSTRFACWNPVLYQVPDGDLLLFYKVGPSPAEWKGMLISSNDGGITWSEPGALPEGYIGPVKNKPVMLNNGCLLCGSSTEGSGWKIHFEITEDSGKTWNKTGHVNDSKIYRAIQPCILVHKNGDLQALCRSRNGAILESWSSDNGLTWSALALTSLPNNNSGIDAVTLSDGRHLLVYNHVKPPEGRSKGPRTPLNAAISEDGKTWYAVLILEDSHVSQYSYPSVIQTSDGLVHVVYTWRRERIKHVVIDPSELEPEKIINGQWPYINTRITVEDGKEILDYLSSLYDDIQSWEKRKNELRQCMYEALDLSILPQKPETKPVITEKRKMNGYSVQNIAIETLPGLFVCGSLYCPLKEKSKLPVILCPNGHFDDGRYRSDQQYRCAMLARMGAMVISYDLFAWGESLLQFKPEDHHRNLAMTIQVLNSIRILDYLLSLDNADSSSVGITGASGGGSQTMLVTALDDRIKVSVPVAMLSCYFYGGCPCESGRPIHLCGKGTNNVEIAAMAAPRAQLVISDGNDWTAQVPDIEYPYLQKIYGYYGKEANVQNIHFPEEGHDYGLNKRLAMYNFMTRHLGLNIDAVKDEKGNIDESKCTIEGESDLYVFGKDDERLPAHTIKKFKDLEDLFNRSIIE